MGKMEKDIKDMVKSHVLAYREVAKTCERYTVYSQTLSQAMLGKWYVSAVKYKALDGELKAMIKDAGIDNITADSDKDALVSVALHEYKMKKESK
jgi:hypothetical protein